MNPFSKYLPKHILVRVETQPGGETNVKFIARIAAHRKHTKKDLFTVRSLYAGVMFTDWEKVKDKKDVIKEHSKNILKSLQGLAEEGWYYDEEYIGGEYVNVKRYYNDWYWFDHDNQKVLGKEL